MQDVEPWAGMEIRDTVGQLIVADKAWNTWPAMIFLSVVAVLTAFVLVHARDESWFGALFIVGITCWSFFWPTRTAVFDTTAQELRLENRWWFGLRQRRMILFHEIAAIGIDATSWRNHDTPTYRIRARLRSGDIVALTNWSGRTGGLPSGTSWSKRDDSSLYDPVLDKYQSAADRIREVVGIG